MKLQQLLHFILQFQLQLPLVLLSWWVLAIFSLSLWFHVYVLVFVWLLRKWLNFDFSSSSFFFLKNNRCNLKLYFLHMFKMISVGFIFLSNFVSTVFGVYYYFSCDFSVTKQRANTCSPTDLLYCARFLSDLLLFY